MTHPQIPTDSARKAAAAYLAMGHIPIPIPRGAKKPNLKGWQNLRITKSELAKYFSDDRSVNVGLLLASGIVDLDLDALEAVAVGQRWIPRTAWVSGRAGKPRSHFWFRPDGPMSYRAYDGPDGTRFLELRTGTGHQTVVPPSRHPDGDEVTWDTFDDGPTPMPAAEIIRTAGEVGALAVLVHHWPKISGRRQDAFLALAGGLARAKWEPGRAEEFIAVLADLTGDEEGRARVQTYARTAEKVRAGEPATGWKSLGDYLTSHGPAVVKTVCDWLGCNPAEATNEPQVWPELIPLLTPLPDLPLFPADILPSWLGDWAAATAEALQVPIELPATLGLAVCSAGIAQKFVANPRPGWIEPVNTYWLTALPPSDRKTQTFSRAMAPVFDLQDRARAESAPARREAEATQKALAKRVNRLEDQFAKAKDAAERQQAMEELQTARQELDELIVPVIPLLVVDDETPDNLTKMLCEQGGRILQASAEGTLFENIDRWSDKPSFDVYLKAFSGDPLSVGRVTRDRTECRHPSLTCAIAPQPAVVEALGEHPALAGRGFLARWFYSLPKSKVGRRTVGPPPVPDAVRDAYSDGVIALWSLPAAEDDEGKPRAYRVEFTKAADEVIRQFERELEPKLAEGEELWFLHGWAGKAAGGAVRIAMILHMAESATTGTQRPDPVPVDVAKRAVRLVRDYLIPHAHAAFCLLGADPKVNLSKKVVRWLTSHRLAEFNVRDAQQCMKGSIHTVDDLYPVLDLIERHHYIRRIEVGRREGPGRPRSQKYEVNPAALDASAESKGPNDDRWDTDPDDGGPGHGPSGGGSPGKPGGYPVSRDTPDSRPPTWGDARGNFGDIGDIGVGVAYPNTFIDETTVQVADSPHSSYGPQNSERCADRANFGDIGDIGVERACPATAMAERSVQIPGSSYSNYGHQDSEAFPARANFGDIGDIGDIGAGTSLPNPSEMVHLDEIMGGPPYGQYPQYPQNSKPGHGAEMVMGRDTPGQYPQNPHNSKPVAVMEMGSGIPGQYPQYSNGHLLSCPADEPASYDGDVTPATPFLLIDSATDLPLVMNAVAESTWVGLDTETTGLDPRADRLRLLTLDCDTNDGGRLTYLVDAFAVDLRPLWESLAAAKVVIHNASFDLAFLGRLGFIPGQVHDTLLLSQVLYAGARTKGVAPLKHGLEDCCQRELGVELAKDLQSSNWSGRLTHEQLAYAATDASVLVPLYRSLMEKLKEEGLAETATIESAAIPCLAWMSAAGVPLDAAQWRTLAVTARLEADQAKVALNAAAPKRPGTLFEEVWNWDSPVQVKEAFAILGIPVESTADGVLASLDHPLAALLRDYREGSKRASTYGDAWLKHVARDGRVYPRWVQLGANSGRMACSGSNMQNLPRGEYRKCVAAPPGRVLVKADYSQVELRIAAKVSGDKALLAAYQRGEDLHTLTARQVLGIAEVTKEHRQLAKALNFGLLYGMGAKSFRNYARANYQLELTEQQAVGYCEAFFKAYPGLKRWHRSIGDTPRDTRTLAGRRAIRVEQFNEKLNLPVQGTGADGLKKALALLWERRSECPTAVPVLAVHDEIVVECPEGDAEKASEWLKRAMLDGMAPLVAPIPVEVEVKVGRTWGGD